jgi:hypothetical protein
MSYESVTFLASFPAIQAAIKVDGAGGARIQLDIPESELANFIRAMTWRGEVLQVSIQRTETNDGTKPTKHNRF